ncbi:oligosaccharide flippase family protein [Pedobacter sandarakinus]|uniref:oligosaccharide flippase family protein n=1 Tax=Pedobacter sandarakinus TaxID=353156 RepID=UPI002246B852|nr:oligosaccharide flippase family protein [Pedobacter sandarakinus]MCX2574030.1 oligosaccharide flippase family protein [Pedobacter sandarakinus]
MEIRRLIYNFGYLSFLQIVNLILPILTFPYIVKIVGSSFFGDLSFATAITSFAVVIINFGFDLSVTPQIAKNKNDVVLISNHFYAVLILKFLLLICSVAVIAILTICLPQFFHIRTLLFYSIGGLVGGILFPTWFLMGMEQMKFVTIFNVSTKIFFTVLMFLFVKEKSSYISFFLFSNLAGILTGLFGFIWSVKLFNIPLIIPSREMLWSVFSKSKNFFFSRIANDGSRYFATILIGINFSSTLVGYYSLVDKIFATSISIGGIPAQLMYPLMSRKKDLSLFIKVLKFTIVASLVFISCLYGLKEHILLFFFHSSSPILLNIYDNVIWCIVIANVSSLIGFPLLGVSGYQNEANFSLVYGSVFYFLYIVLASIFTQNILVLGISLCAYELVAFLIRVYYISKFRLLKTN